jgi:hypothetical protein
MADAGDFLRRLRRVLPACAIAAFALACLCPFASAYAADVPPEFVHFQADRARMALDLSKPIALCEARHDTSNPVFHGCIDWHSAVHGVWALSAYTWATKDQRYKPLIDSLLQPSLLAQERKNIDASPDFEMPYGRSWFLRLAIDYRRAFGTNALDAFGDDVAASLMAYYTSVKPDPASIAYQSASWALLNLYDYGEARHDTRMVDFVKAKVEKYYEKGAVCPLQTEIDSAEFMAVCTNWAWLVGKIMPRTEFVPWVAVFFRNKLALVPVTNPISVHQRALNFSRAWGFWNVYRQTGDVRFLTAYLGHFHENYDDRQLWDGRYEEVAHWVPQFGMLALIVTYYDFP